MKKSALIEREKWQHKNRNKQRLYEDRSHAKHLILNDHDGTEIAMVLRLINKHYQSRRLHFIGVSTSVADELKRQNKIPML